MAETRPGGMLAQTHEGQPGLPRGRSRLPLGAVRASQRERLLRSVIAAVSDIGYPAVTVAEVVRRARVSRAAFYAHFADKEECFLAATGQGRQLMFARVMSEARTVPADAQDEQVIRAACRAFLAFLADEPAFARVFYIDMPAAGPRAVGRLEAAGWRFADLNRAWHQRARERHPDWPAVPQEAYLALSGATAELVRSMVRADRTDELPGLEDALVSLHLAVLAARPWPSQGGVMTIRPEFGPDYGEEMWEPGGTPPGGHKSRAEHELEEHDEEEREIEYLDPEDNELHFPGQVCERCGTAVNATQDARVLPDGRWVHEVCPVHPSQGKDLPDDG